MMKGLASFFFGESPFFFDKSLVISLFFTYFAEKIKEIKHI